jgi:hypothetical protein
MCYRDLRIQDAGISVLNKIDLFHAEKISNKKYDWTYGPFESMYGNIKYISRSLQKPWTKLLMPLRQMTQVITFQIKIWSYNF